MGCESSHSIGKRVRQDAQIAMAEKDCKGLVKKRKKQNRKQPLELGCKMPWLENRTGPTHSQKRANHDGREGSQNGRGQKQRQNVPEIGGEETPPEQFPHGTLKSTTFYRNTAQKVKELGCGEKNMKFKSQFTGPKNEGSPNLKKRKRGNGWGETASNAKCQKTKKTQCHGEK